MNTPQSELQLTDVEFDFAVEQSVVATYNEQQVILMLVLGSWCRSNGHNPNLPIDTPDVLRFMLETDMRDNELDLAEAKYGVAEYDKKKAELVRELAWLDAFVVLWETDPRVEID